MKSIGEVAELAGVTVETLRHYDKIGLLEPRARSTAGYRLYGSEELLRLREILVWRLLGFSLASVGALLDDPEHDRTEALRRQREIVGAQRRRFDAMTRGLDRALAADHEAGAVGEDDVFADFAISSLFDEDERRDEPSRRVSAQLRLVDGPAHLNGHRAVKSPRRIVATDPIRVAESLLAVGVVPVGTGTYESDSLTFQPWPALVEHPVRDVIRDVGSYGSDARLVELAEPDLIVDILLHNGVPLAGESVAAVAPTVIVDVDQAPPVVPRFRSMLPAVAESVGLGDRVDGLLAVWAARTSALRAHLDGHEASILILWSDDRLWAPNERYPPQVLSEVGLRLRPVDQGLPTSRGRATELDEGALAQLDAPTLFTHKALGATRERFEDLLGSRAVRGLPAVAARRTCELGAEFLDSGWFSANWQLDKIARTYGIERARATLGDDGVYLAANPVSGEIALASTAPAQQVTLSGPRIAELTLLPKQLENRIALDPDAVSHFMRFPEEYQATFESGRALRFMPDRESAFERVFSARSPARVAGAALV